MRILYLNPAGAQLGGAEMSLLDLIASLRAAKPDWSFHLVASSDGSLVDEARALGADSRVLKFPPALARIGDAGIDVNSFASTLGALIRAVPATAHYIRSLRDVIKSIAPDLIHTNGFKMHVIGGWANFVDAPLVWNIRDYVKARKIMSPLVWAHSRWCSGIITNSRSVADDVATCSTARIFTVYDAVDLARFSPCGECADLDELSNMPPAGHKTVRIGLVGTLARWKGHGVFLEAISKLSNEPRFRAYVVGGPIYATQGSQYSIGELRSLARRMGIADRVGFTGHVKNPAAVYRALDVVVHASTKPEPFGRTIAEAMACGRAVVVSELGGAAEIISRGVDVLTHIPGDAASLADSITRLINDSSLRHRLGRHARASAERRFNLNRLADEVGRIYESVTS